MNLFANPTRYLFFTGKGGVGKTSLSCATAVALADQGKKVFLVCTDPASNLSDVLGCEISSEVVAHPEVPGLSATNIDPEAAAAKYREKVIGPYRGKLPEAALASMEEQLSGACTMEIAAFDEFAALLGDADRLAGFDFIIFDTAPTGHTLRLLQLPSAWDGFIETNTTGTSCLGPLAGLTRQHAIYKKTIATLCDPALTTVVLVCRPDRASLDEAARTSAELSELGMANMRLVINGIFRATSDDETARAWEERSKTALAAIPEPLAGLDITEAPMLPFAPLGVARLRLFREALAGRKIPAPEPPPSDTITLPPPLSTLLDELAGKKSGVIMTMGKGGVGKTILATEIAKHLAGCGQRVVLATTDPAAHLDFSLGETTANLTVTRIDPKQETRKYTEEVMAEAGAHLDEEGRKLLAEDLRSPCTEEIAVFQAFARMVDRGEDRFIVLDTAPTGHTLLLLDAAQAYHREVERTTRELPEAVKKLLPRMRDPKFTSIFIVTLPETTPINEAASLQEDLKRAQITPAGWIINQSLAPLELKDPVLLARQREEYAHIRRITAGLAARVYVHPWQSGL